MTPIQKTLQQSLSGFTEYQTTFKSLSKYVSKTNKTEQLEDQINCGLAETKFMNNVSEYMNTVLQTENELKQRNNLLQLELELVRSKLIKSELLVDELKEKLKKNEKCKIEEDLLSDIENSAQLNDYNYYDDEFIINLGLEEYQIMEDGKDDAEEAFYKEILSICANSTTDLTPIWKVAEDIEEKTKGNRLFNKLPIDSYQLDFDYLSWYNAIDNGSQYSIVNQAFRKLGFIYRQRGMHTAAKLLQHCYTIQCKKQLSSSAASSGYASQSDDGKKY